MVVRDDSFSLRTAVLSRWLLGLVLVPVGLGAGVAVAQLKPTTYTSEVRLAVGEGDLAAQAVPGFALATQELASNYARFVTAPPVQSSLPAGVAAHVLSVSASPVPESNVIRVEVRASDPRSSVAAAAEAGRQLVAQVDKITAAGGADRTLQQFTALSEQVAQAQQIQADAQAVVDRARNQPGGASADARKALVQANVRLAELQVQQSALGALYQSQVGRGPSENGLTVVSPAAVSENDARSRAELYGLAGAALGAGVWVAASAVSEQRGRRLRQRGPAYPGDQGRARKQPSVADLLGADRASSDVADTESRQVWTGRH